MVPDLVLVLFSDYNRELHGEIQGILTTKWDIVSRMEKDTLDARISTYVLIEDIPEIPTYPATLKIKGGVTFYE